jgi:hypothetical protein
LRPSQRKTSAKSCCSPSLADAAPPRWRAQWSALCHLPCTLPWSTSQRGQGPSALCLGGSARCRTTCLCTAAGCLPDPALRADLQELSFDALDNFAGLGCDVDLRRPSGPGSLAGQLGWQRASASGTLPQASFARQRDVPRSGPLTPALQTPMVPLSMLGLQQQQQASKAQVTVSPCMRSRAGCCAAGSMPLPCCAVLEADAWGWR